MATIRIFWERDLDDVLSNVLTRVRERINGESHTYLLNVNENDYIAHVTAEFQIDPLTLDFEGIHASFLERMIPAERFPPLFNVYAGKSYPKQVVRYHIPFSGDPNLLNCIPNPRVMNTLPVEIANGNVCFELINFSDDVEQIKRDAESNYNGPRFLDHSIS